MPKTEPERVVDMFWIIVRILLVSMVLWIVLGFYEEIRREKPDVSPGGSTAGLLPAE